VTRTIPRARWPRPGRHRREARAAERQRITELEREVQRLARHNHALSVGLARVFEAVELPVPPLVAEYLPHHQNGSPVPG
jgi:hypothetical protein